MQPMVVVAPSAESRRFNDVEQAWRAVFWFAVMLSIVGCTDLFLAWVPFRLGVPEWEFGTIAASFAGLPLMTMGLAGLLVSAIGRKIRWQVLVVATILLLFALWIALASVVFALDVPIALRAVQGIARIGIIKAIAKTAILGAVFFIGYLVAAILAWRFARRLRVPS